jgi:hypothetical protein
MADHGTDARAREILERGYTVFERAYTEEEVAFFRDRLVASWTRLGRPSLSASPPGHPAEDVEIGPAGMVLLKLTRHYPETAARLYKPYIIDTLRAVLGEDMYLELPAGALSDGRRPFFDWHTHIDGVDDAYYENKRPFPTFERAQRVTHILYLDDLTEDNGQLLVYPRRITDPTRPPFDPRSQHWEGQVAISCPRGSVVVVEQCTWHAAHRKRSPGERAFVGSYFASKGSRTTPLADPSLADWNGDDELFRSVLPRR